MRTGQRLRERCAYRIRSGVRRQTVFRYWGGAHCCEWTRVYRYDPASNSYTVSQHLWGDPGYKLEQIGKQLLFVSADDRFAYAFTDFADSVMPIPDLVVLGRGLAERHARTQAADQTGGGRVLAGVSGRRTPAARAVRHPRSLGSRRVRARTASTSNRAAQRARQERRHEQRPLRRRHALRPPCLRAGIAPLPTQERVRLSVSRSANKSAPHAVLLGHLHLRFGVLSPPSFRDRA